jgi:hypothetical protein
MRNIVDIPQALVMMWHLGHDTRWEKVGSVSLFAAEGEMLYGVG